MQPSSPLISVTTVGAGAMGCLFAARLAERGVRVTVVDVDRERLAIIDRDGIRLTDDSGSRAVPVRTAFAAEVKPPTDLVLLFTKGMHSAAAIRSIAHLARHRPLALTLQNGIGNADLLAASFGPEQVLLGTAHVPADLTAPASVVTHGFGTVELGGFTPEAHAFAPRVAGLLQSAGFDARVASDIDAAVWEKLAFNAALNAVGLICQVRNGGIDNDPGRRIAFSVVDEAVQVAAALGIRIDRNRITATIDAALRQHAHHKASMLQDREQGRPSEIETINGAIAREGARVGVPTPVCNTLTDLVRIIELDSRARKETPLSRLGGR